MAFSTCGPVLGKDAKGPVCRSFKDVGHSHGTKHVFGFCLLLPKDLAEISENVWKAVRKTTISSTYERLDKKTMVSVQIF